MLPALAALVVRRSWFPPPFLYFYPISPYSRKRSNDPDFYGRFFAGIFLYLRQYKADRPWRGLLILQRRSQDLGLDTPYQLQLDAQVQRFYLENLLHLVNLSTNLAMLRLLILPDLEVAAAAQDILQRTPTEAEFQRRLDLVEAILVNKFPQLSTEDIFKMLDLRTADVTQTRFYQEVFQVGQKEGRQEGRQIGQQEGQQEGRQIGQQEGRQIGQQEGRQEGETDLVLRLLIRRCGVLSPVQEQQIRGLEIDRLEALGDALLDFTNMEDLDDWLKIDSDGLV